MSYQAQPGSIPYKVIQHLKTLPEGTELSTAELNDVLGQPADLNLAPMLHTARSAGVLDSRRIRGERSSRWRLGDEAPMIQRTVPAQRFNAALWIDGSLMLVGVPRREDGTVILTPEQTQWVKGLVAA